MSSDHSDVGKVPSPGADDKPLPVERRAWFPPDLADFDTPMEVTAYAGRR